MMNLNSTRFAFAAALIATVATGCAEDEESARPQNTASRAQALTSEVEENRDAPTGDLSENNAGALFETWDEWELMVDGGMMFGGLATDIDDIDPSCTVGDDEAGTMDVACATGGASSGSVTYDVHIDGGNVFVYYGFDELCVDGVCGTGEGAVKVETGDFGARVTVAGDLQITDDAGTHQLKYGVTTSAGEAGVSNEVVLWLDEESFVVRTSITGDGTSVEVQGGDGSYQCDLTGEGDGYSGSCLGGADGEIDF